MSMRVSDKVAWLEGVLLLPQHFQQMDRYHESLLTCRLEALSSMCWGVRQIEIDERALQQGVVEIAQFEGVLPDGTPLSLGAHTGLKPKPRPIEGFFPPSQRALLVNLAVPAERPRVNNYALSGEALRYTVSAQKVFDSARDDRVAEVQCALPNASIVFGNEERAGLVTLPVAAIMRDARGEYALSDSYIPPTLHIGGSPVVKRRLDRILRTMIARQRTLSEARRLTSEGRVEFTAADVTTFLQLSALNSTLPKAYYLARAKDVPPNTAFLILSELAGQLAVFSPLADMTNPLDFDFADLETTFRTLFDLIDQLLMVSDTERFVTCPLRASGAGRHYADLRDTRIDQCAGFWLSVETTLPRPQVVDEFIKRAKVASHGDMDFILSKHVGGVRVTESIRPPVEFPVKPGVVYFQVPAPEQDVYWRHAMKDGNIAVWLPPMLDQAQPSIKLMGTFGSRA
jgi:type VI secretion system protein ImpJ